MASSPDPMLQVFDAANSRLADLSSERCRELELSTAKALRRRHRGVPMLAALVRTMNDTPPSEEYRSRAHHTLRRLFVETKRGGMPRDMVQVTLNAWLDGQTDLALRHLTLEVYLRPWGER